MDDFDIEVTDLRTGKRQPAPLDAQVPAASTVAARSKRPRTQRQKLGAILAGFAVVVALAVILASTPDSRQALSTVFHVPTPTATPQLAPGANALVLLGVAPWGTVKLDGKQLPDSYLSSGDQVLYAERGRHTLDVHQPPFPDVHCIVSVPAGAADTCPISAAFGGGANIPYGTRALNLGARIDQLSPDLRAELLEAARAAMTIPNNHVTVRAGEHYLDANGNIITATSPLIATFIADLDETNNTMVNINGQTCNPLCDATGAGMPSNGTFLFFVALRGGWRFARPDGTDAVAFAPVTPAGNQFDSIRQYQIEQMAATWDGHWHAEVQSQDGTGARGAGRIPCDIGMNMTSILSSGADSQNPPQFFVQYTATGDTAIEGCLIVARLQLDGQVPASNGAYFLYRFGALLAANDEAHKLLPGLPRADAYERALTQKWAAQLPQD